MTKPDKSNPLPNKPAPTRVYDGLLDPMPLPDVVESDSDTAWGLWEDVVQAHENETLISPSVEPKDSPYDDTVPMDISKSSDLDG